MPYSPRFTVKIIIISAFLQYLFSPKLFGPKGGRLGHTVPKMPPSGSQDAPSASSIGCTFHKTPPSLQLRPRCLPHGHAGGILWSELCQDAARGRLGHTYTFFSFGFFLERVHLSTVAQTRNFQRHFTDSFDISRPLIPHVNGEMSHLVSIFTGTKNVLRLLTLPLISRYLLGVL